MFCFMCKDKTCRTCGKNSTEMLWVSRNASATSVRRTTRFVSNMKTRAKSCLHTTPNHFRALAMTLLICRQVWEACRSLELAKRGRESLIFRQMSTTRPAQPCLSTRAKSASLCDWPSTLLKSDSTESARSQLIASFSSAVPPPPVPTNFFRSAASLERRVRCAVLAAIVFEASASKAIRYASSSGTAISANRLRKACSC
mmetsp:Transcript_138023/g.440892  ORF Transcript_138023/g.440892 Transcript_138023/m.440892 type:complete len:200 (+) Transcript_138023:1174-1773(+)